MRLKKTNTRPILSLVCLIIFLGMNLAPIIAANITVNSGMQNSDIQSLINNAKSGDTLNFKSGNYHNVSLIINKKLNVVSTKNVTLNGNDSSGDDGTGKTTFVFYFTNQSSGSSLSGFKINANSDYSIIVNNVKNLNLNSNTINGGFKGSIYVEGSSNIHINNNTISNSGGNGITIDSSKAVNLYNNRILNNPGDGITVKNSQQTILTLNLIFKSGINGISLNCSNSTIIHNNSINNNNGEGISLFNTDTTKIIGNNITYNILNGILFEGWTQQTHIYSNYLIHNLNGIYLDSISYGDLVGTNYIVKSYISSNTKYPVFYTGNGIKVGDNYQDTEKRIVINHNSIFGNQNFQIQGSANFDNFPVGPNFYGTNNKWACGVCPMINTDLDYAKVVSAPGGFQLIFYDPTNANQQVTQIIDQAVTWTVSVLNSDGTTTKILNAIGQISNGTSFLNFTGDKNKTYIASVTINGVQFTYQLDPDNSTSQNNSNSTSGNNNGTSGGTGAVTNGTGGNTTSNSTGGTSNLNGTGSGDTGSGKTTSNGTLTGTGQDETQIGVDGSSANQGGQQSAGDKSGGSSNSVEVAIKNAINNSVNNPFNNIGILALLGLIGIGYFKRDKLK